MIDPVMIERPWLTPIQDNAPSHASVYTIREMNRKNLSPISWPAFLPRFQSDRSCVESNKRFLAAALPKSE